MNRYDKKRDYYFKPFQPDKTDASAWYNLKRIEDLDQEGMIPEKIRTRFRRRHLMRYYPGGYGKKVCIRCGWVNETYSGKSEPECLSKLKSVRVLRMKNLKK
jgi:hypothetical protein